MTIISWPCTMWRPALVMVCVVCRFVCLSHTNISETKRDRAMVTIWSSNRNPGFPIQNLPSDLRPEVQFRHFGRFWWVELSFQVRGAPHTHSSTVRILSFCIGPALGHHNKNGWRAGWREATAQRGASKRVTNGKMVELLIRGWLDWKFASWDIWKSPNDGTCQSRNRKS